MIHTITQQLQRFADDERAVSPVVGFVLMFALIMIVFTLYQAEVVPAQNAEVEFKHSQTVEGEMSRLNDAIQEAGTSGVAQSVTVSTGVQYPDRALAINPGTPAGTLKTSDETYSVDISGLTTADGKFLNGSVFSVESKQLRYEANYNVHQQEPTVVIENGLLYTQYESGTVVKSADIISGNRINLPLIHKDAEYQKSKLSTTINVEPVSTSTEYVTVESDGDPTITLDTALDLNEDAASRLEEDLEAESTVETATYSDSSNQITIKLTDGTYKLRITEVAFGGVEPRDEHYLTSEDETTTPTVEVGETETFTVSARDELGNFVPQADVTASTDGAGTFARSNGSSVNNSTTNDDGRVTFSYTPSAADAGNTTTVSFTLDNGSGDAALDTVSYNLTITNSTDTNDPNDIGGDIDNGYALPESRRVTIDSATASGNSVEFEFNNRGDVNMTVTRVQFSGYVGHFPSSSFATNGTFADTDVELNGETVLLNAPFTVGVDDTTTATLSDLDVNKVQTGLLIVSVKYQYTENGTTKTDTATYSVPVVK